ncbi:MAG: glycoside hydrolase family 20 zincin-like fold domain-containing protein [Armatimonadota bacterium]|nr:glycoside hydrolase family 20 zincin-like fold domain-containing protein [Armatimonadota bacterium]
MGNATLNRFRRALPDWRLRLPVQVDAPSALKTPAQLLRQELERMLGKGAVQDRGKTVVRLQLDRSRLRREEEYALHTSDRHVELSARDQQGAFWAVHTLIALLETGAARRLASDTWLAPGVAIKDHPHSPHRAFMIQGAWAGSEEAYRHHLRLLARLKVRYVAVEFGSQVVLDYDPSIATGIRLSKAQAKGIIDYARLLGMEPIGYLNLLAHLDRAYQKSPYTAHGGIMIQDEQVYPRFVFPVLSEMLEVYGKIRWFHCGMDEAWELFPWLHAQGYDCSRLLARHISLIHRFLRSRGVRMVIWHDMLLDQSLQEQLKAPIGPAHGGAPHFTSRAIDQIPREVILNYWFYDPQETYPALDWLQRKGFEVWASPWLSPFSLVRYAHERRAPTMGTLWADPPGCLTAESFAFVPALYAQVAWNPEQFRRESDALPHVKMATRQALFRRPEWHTGRSEALLLQPGTGRRQRLKIPEEIGHAPEQAYGIPFDLSKPVALPPPAHAQEASTRLQEAKEVILPNGARLPVHGVNRSRGEGELIVYIAPLSSTGTNIWGAEAAVNSQGVVMQVTGVGTGGMSIPPGGAVLSAHAGGDERGYHGLLNLKVGERIAVVDEQGQRIFGAGASTLGEVETARLIRERSWMVEIGERCERLLLALSSALSALQGDLLGEFVVEYRDGSTETLPIRYAHQLLAEAHDGMLQLLTGESWLLQRNQEQKPLVVSEWRLKRSDAPLSSLTFRPTLSGLEAGVKIVGVTALLAQSPERGRSYR